MIRPLSNHSSLQSFSNKIWLRKIFGSRKDEIIGTFALSNIQVPTASPASHPVLLRYRYEGHVTAIGNIMSEYRILVEENL
jgi:hypothetical protein